MIYNRLEKLFFISTKTLIRIFAVLKVFSDSEITDFNKQN